MGAESSKNTTTPQPDLNTALFQLKMSTKRFLRESKKSEKEKEKNMQKAETCLKKGDEESARLYAINAQNNLNDYKKYLRMSSRLDTIAGQLKSNHAVSNVMKVLSNNVNPILMQEVDKVDIKDMCKNFEVFQNNFDKLTVTGNIMGDNFDKMTTEGNTQENADQLFNQLKNKFQHNTAKETLGQQNNPIKDAPKKQEKNEDFEKYLNDLKG